MRDRRRVAGMTSRTLPVVTGSIVIDLAHLSPTEQRHQVGGLQQAPHGSCVLLHVGPLQPWTSAPHIDWFVAEAACVRSLVVDVQGDADVVGSWVQALRDHIQHLLAGTPAAQMRSVTRRPFRVVDGATP